MLQQFCNTNRRQAPQVVEKAQGATKLVQISLATCERVQWLRMRFVRMHVGASSKHAIEKNGHANLLSDNSRHLPRSTSA